MSYWGHGDGVFYAFGGMKGIDEALYERMVEMNEELANKLSSISYEVLNLGLCLQ
jgi:hypothetical protein